jgi:hypothetical protein
MVKREQQYDPRPDSEVFVTHNSMREAQDV